MVRMLKGNVPRKICGRSSEQVVYALLHSLTRVLDTLQRAFYVQTSQGRLKGTQAHVQEQWRLQANTRLNKCAQGKYHFVVTITGVVVATVLDLQLGQPFKGLLLPGATHKATLANAYKLRRGLCQTRMGTASSRSTHFSHTRIQARQWSEELARQEGMGKIGLG